jgi:F0F1-type ATP synthase membrane subunit b/b'
VTQKAEDNEKEKASVVRRMVQSGADLSDDRREALLRLRQKVEQLWQKREGTQTKQSGDNTTTSSPNS